MEQNTNNYDNDMNTKKTDFNEALSYLVETANINGGTLTQKEIKNSLDSIIPDAAMYDMVYQYMTEKNITVEGYHTNSPRIMDAKERNMIEMYLKELDNRQTCTASEEHQTLLHYLNDHQNHTFINQLTEMNISLVPPIADEFQSRGVAYGDLIQEGNLGLMEGIMTFKSIYEDNLSEAALLDCFHKHIISKIRNAINDCILEQEASLRISAHAADRANELDRASVALGKEFNRTPTISELAKYVALSEDEVERILKMSLNALEK